MATISVSPARFGQAAFATDAEGTIIKIMEVKNDHNVYILGAGFSRAAGLPLISDFLVQMRDSHEWLMANKRSMEADAVAKVLEFRLQAASAAYWVNLDLENIEELFSLASATTGDMNRHIRLAIAATLDFARQTKRPKPVNLHVRGESSLFFVPTPGSAMPRRHPAWIKLPDDVLPVQNQTYSGPYLVEPYAYYAARLLGMCGQVQPKGENTFITFNYDLVLEDALNSLKVPFYYPGFGGEQETAAGAKNTEAQKPSIPILKLHGSVNWARRSLPDNPRTARVLHETYYQLLTSGQEPDLVPPTWKKVLGGHLEAVWDSAVQQLGSATRIIVIGFSIPPTDMHFKYLLAAGLQKNAALRQILFVNPYPNDKERDEFKLRVKKLLREAYVDTKIDFVFTTLEWFLRDNGVTDQKLSVINRPLEYGVTMNI